MKKILFVLLALCTVMATGFADMFTLDNQTTYPNKNKSSKMAIQWASCAQEVADANNSSLQGSYPKVSTLEPITRPGKVQVTIPERAAHFRILIWTNEKKEPQLVTNWVDIVPNKTYVLETGHLVPVVLMAGSGC